jgi:hypothetical protein
MLKVERNNAMDELAMAQGSLLRALGKEKDRAEYWRKWVEGDLEKAGWWSRIWGLLPRKRE